MGMDESLFRDVAPPSGSVTLNEWKICGRRRGQTDQLDRIPMFSPDGNVLRSIVSVSPQVRFRAFFALMPIVPCHVMKFRDVELR
jgi:hypothetical protein